MARSGGCSGIARYYIGRHRLDAEIHVVLLHAIANAHLLGRRRTSALCARYAG